MPFPPQHPVIEQLIQSHVDFITQQILNTEILKEEAHEITTWLFTQKLADFFSFEHVLAAIEHLFFEKKASDLLKSDIAQHLQVLLLHPLNQTTQFKDIIDSAHVHQLASYIASKTTHRQKFIQDIVHHPAFARLFTDLIQQVLHDYFENSMSNQRPSVSRFMKMGKSVFENMTDLNFTKTLTAYLEKNIHKFGDLSEKLLNQQFDDDKFFTLQTNLWEHIKHLPLNTLCQYIEVTDLEHTVHLAEQFPQHLSETDYIKQQLHDHVSLWYAKYQSEPMAHIFNTIHCNEQDFEHYIIATFMPILQKIIHQDVIQDKIAKKLREFYYAEHTLHLLKQI